MKLDAYGHIAPEITTSNGLGIDSLKFQPYNYYNMIQVGSKLAALAAVGP